MARGSPGLGNFLLARYRFGVSTKNGTRPSRFCHLLLRSESHERNKEHPVTERFLAALFGLLLSGSAVAADFLVEVRVLVQRGCMLITQQRDAGAQALGRIDLGAAARLDGPDAPLSGVLLSQRPPRLECNPDTAYQVRVDGGQHGGVGELRFLASDDTKARPIPIGCSVMPPGASRWLSVKHMPRVCRIPGRSSCRSMPASTSWPGSRAPASTPTGSKSRSPGSEAPCTC